MGVITVQGAVWDGDRARPGRVTVGADGVIEELLPEDPLPSVEVITGAWVGPALVDAHVHLAFGGPEQMLAGGVGAVRDLGGPLERALEWRRLSSAPMVAVAGEIVTTPGGYPTTSWGADGFGRPVNGPRSAAEAVRLLAEAGVDVVKVALEPAGGLTVLDLPTTRAIVTAAHAAGLSVTCHALTAPMVARALDAGVDELAHTPVEPLSTALVERMARARTTVVSTLETLIAGGAGDAVMANAKAFVRAGVRLVYGTDLGNTGTRPGASSAELARLAAAGLGRDGALRAATYGSAQVAGLAGRVDVDVTPGARTVLAVLPADPVEDPSAWDTPIAVVAGGRVVGGTAAVWRG